MGVRCRDLETALVCFKNAAGVFTTLVAHYEYRENAAGGTIVYAVRYTGPDGTPVDTSGGTVTAGSCPVSPPDVEWERLCDVSAAGVVTEFWCRTITSFNAAGTPTTVVANFALDKVTPYVPTGTVTMCNLDCDVVAPVGLVTAWG